MKSELSRTKSVPVLTSLVVLIVSATATPLARAQVKVTVVTTTGERHEGANFGFRVDEGEVAVRTGPHTEPRIPVDKVAMIEFAPSADEISPGRIKQRRGRNHLLVMRDGTLMRGRLIRAGHADPADETTPYVVTFKAEGEEHRLDVDRVSRIILNDMRRGPGARASRTAGDKIVVSARQRWTPTGIAVHEGETVRFEASGELQLSTDANDMAGPAGSLAGRRAREAPVRNALAGALIGRIDDDGQPFAIGDRRQVTMQSSGELFLGINDDWLDDNRGELVVRVEPKE